MQIMDEHYKANLKVVLDFVERWNKNDEERDVAIAAQYLAEEAGL